jgi:hypothetical protein
MSKKQVFVSHAQEDADFANALRTWLDDAILGAVDFFVSSDSGSISLGYDWTAKIRDALTHSSLMLILVSPASASNRWVNFEAGAGYAREIPVVPICLGGLRLEKLELPLSLLEGIELPGVDGQERLLELVAKSAGLHTPKSPPELTLPARTIESIPTQFAKAVESVGGESLLDLTRSKSAALLQKADPSQVQFVRDLVKEALFVMELHHWAGNRDNPAKALTTLQSRLKHPVLISGDVAQLFLEHADQIANKTPEKEPPPGGFDSRGYDRVREMIEPYLDALPTLGDYELALFQYPPEIYVPLLFLEMTDTEGYQNWNAIRIAADGEYNTVVLPEVERTLKAVRFLGYEHSKSVEMGRLVLGADFDGWYKKLRGRSFDEDVSYMQKAFDDRFAKPEGNNGSDDSQ